MRTTVTLDDDLLADIEKLSGIRDRSQLLREALLALRHQIASQRLALLGGSEPALTLTPRRRAAALGAAEPVPAVYAAGTGRRKARKG
ncbi:MAG: type II toxin-antitoxin system VapB family antitoxin [Rhodocyclales bacterium]|nr:type II toxin-antitoxin system VapB family antitoxin [Rhodocyclales bacterium]